MTTSTTIAMLLADARLPSGGHAHSSGMEPAILGGLRTDAVPAYLNGRAHTQSLVDAGTAVVARRRFLELGESDRTRDTDDGSADADGLDHLDALRDVDDAWAARTPSRAQREASRVLGRGCLRLASETWPADRRIRACARLTLPSRPLVLGAIAAATGLSAVDLVRLVVYDDAQSAAAAALKLVPLNPSIGVRWVLDACAAAEPFVDTIARLDTPDAIPASSCPESEGWAEAHHLLTRKLFRA